MENKLEGYKKEGQGMKEKIKGIVSLMVIVLLLPYVITLLVNGNPKIKSDPFLGEEEAILALVVKQIPFEYEKEALKAQAVIARTNFYLQEKEEKEKEKKEAYRFLHQLEKQKPSEEFQKGYEKVKEAISETRGEVLLVEGVLKELPYHAVSAGNTREGNTTFQEEGYHYLPSVKSEKDIESPAYLKTTQWDKKELLLKCKKQYPEIEVEQNPSITVESIDSWNYVTSVKIGEITIGGEEFRTILQLNSSAFTLLEENETITITTKGLGHGVGLSQYGASLMALEKKNYIQILTYYYKDVEVKEYAPVQEKE